MSRTTDLRHLQYTGTAVQDVLRANAENVKRLVAARPQLQPFCEETLRALQDAIEEAQQRDAASS